MTLEDLMKIVEEIIPIPPLKIVVSKFLAPTCSLRLPPVVGKFESTVFLLGSQAWKDLLGENAVVSLPGDYTIRALTGVPVEFVPKDWRP